MAGNRVDLHEKLVAILGSRNVYFQPPSSVKLSYPCIVYKRGGMDIKRADDKAYHSRKLYSVTVIDKNPDSRIPDKILELEYSSFDRHFTADGLNHDVYSVYY